MSLAAGPSPAVALGLVVLATDDLPRLAAFYEHVTGWARQVDDDVYVELAAPGGVRLGLYVARAYAANLGSGAPVERAGTMLSRTEIYLVTADLDASLDRAVAAGGRVLSPAAARAWGDVVAYVSDPDGGVCALAAARSL